MPGLPPVGTGGGSRPARQLRSVWIAAAVVCAALAFVPWPEPAPPGGAGGRPFAWNQAARWSALEAAFREARARGCPGVADLLDARLAESRALLDGAPATVGIDAPLLDRIERDVFDLAPMVAACPQRLPDYVRIASAARAFVKRQSRHWDVRLDSVRGRLYRILYGSRAAVEEVMLQAPPALVPALVGGDDEPSATPSAEVLGMTLHSGDILVSRGGAPTSALIARGNDFPGNFSHVALLVVDERSHAASVVEAHIERGVAVSSLAEYLRDVKLRVMVLRLRSDLPALTADPLLPHRAAARALEETRDRHIPYDFAMDYADHSKLFCSEVASSAYGRLGVTLWMGVSRISSPGLVRWLSGFGVRRFVTEEPSDLEYDPQLVVVGEWREPRTLFADHVDNAVVDAMLEGAERGDALGFPLALLPVARAAKAYSAVLNALGRVGPVPEGLSAEAALRTRRFARTHLAIEQRVLALAAEFERARGYRPPYWELVEMARKGRTELGGR